MCIRDSVTVGEFKAIILQAEETLKDVQTQSDDVYPVSYTHLDVYKRQ